MPSEPMYPMEGRLDHTQTTAQIAALEAELRQVRSEAAEQIAKLERQLHQERLSLPMTRNPKTVADNLAVQQQIDALRLAVREKDRVVEELNRTIRGLEDRLEDHYRELDTLALKVSQHERQRAEAEDRADRAERRLARAEAGRERAESAVRATQTGTASALRVDADGRDATSQNASAASADLTTPAQVTGEPRRADPTDDPNNWRLLPAAPTNPPTPAELRRLAAQQRAQRGAGRWSAALLGLLTGATLALACAAGLWWSGVWWPRPHPDAQLASPPTSSNAPITLPRWMQGHG